MMLLHASEKNLYNRMAMNLIFFLNNFELQDDVLKTLVKIYHVTGLCEVGRNIHSVEMAKALSWPDSYSCNQVKYWSSTPISLLWVWNSLTIQLNAGVGLIFFTFTSFYSTGSTVSSKNYFQPCCKSQTCMLDTYIYEMCKSNYILNQHFLNSYKTHKIVWVGRDPSPLLWVGHIPLDQVAQWPPSQALNT